MGDKSKIEWTDATWNPIKAVNAANGQVGWFCTKVSAGCKFCYAERLNGLRGTGLDYKPGHEKDVHMRFNGHTLFDPLRWRRSRMIFPCSMTDLFGSFVNTAWRDAMWVVMALAKQHKFQVVTKREEEMRLYMERFSWERAVTNFLIAATEDSRVGDYWKQQAERLNSKKGTADNIWLGVSCEDQENANKRIPVLLDTPAAVRWVSAEPLIGPIDLFEAGAFTFPGVDWVVGGGESYDNTTPLDQQRHTDPAWLRSLRDQCAQVKTGKVAYFTKQMTRKEPIPADLLVRQYPVAA